MVGGTTRSRSASVVKIASIAPAAPKQWPAAPFVEEPGVHRACSSPSASLITFVSLASPSGVDVACALTYPTSVGSIPASARAALARAGLLPVGSGSVMCDASADIP
jgi:hypothetical protein